MMNMLNILRKHAKYALPLVVIIAISCLMALIFYPMMNAQVRQLPVAILSLDEGASTAQGDVNVGDTMVKKLTGASSDVSSDNSSSDSADEQPMVWTEVASQGDLDKGFADHEYYAAITISKDFTAKQMAVKQAAAKAQIESATALAQTLAKAQAEAAAQGLTGAVAQQYVQTAMQKAIAAQSGDAAGVSGSTSASSDDENAPVITLTIDNSKSPLVASLLKQSVPAMLSQSGAKVDVKTINAGDVKSNSSLPTAAMMGQNVLIMPTYMMSMIVSVLIVSQLGRKQYDSKSQRWGAFGAQLVAALGWSLCVALGACCIFAMLGSGWPPVAMIGFLWLASFSIMAVLLSLMNIALPFGVLCGVLGLGLGMTSGLFPYELLPGFWRDWVYGWVPQRYIGDGVRAVLYSGDGWWNVASEPLMVVICVGLLVFVLEGVAPLGKRNSR
ncbi:ABC-2 family transporter protein [Bifidobacterium hapali]|uniref:ABC-2 family transporter protein n=1 Tax=Bifidobacterium hapali TaxID=1630172 RepID=A0A261G5H1_9BIFI|nr:ABC transporter permease [Bifidobacterium hapali]OZG66445.1 ABC-2 family transporter protein [Bifidobacterium hapali]